MKHLWFVFLLLCVVVFPEFAEAQCAMCKAVVETGGQDNNKMIEGVNNGILYMMGVPYLLMFVVGFAWYKKFGKAKQE